jgi:hypothetical protein
MRLLNPYEWENGMTPRLMSFGPIPIVLQMFRQSARSCDSRNRTALGAPVVPEVIFKRSGLGPSQRMGARSNRSISAPATNPCAWVNCRIRSSWVDWRSGSSGATINARSQHASRNAGQLGSFPIAATTQSPAENVESRIRHLTRSSSTC